MDQPSGPPVGEDGAVEGAAAVDATSPDPAARDPEGRERRRTQDRSSLCEAGVRAVRRAAEGDISPTSKLCHCSLLKPFFFSSIICTVTRKNKTS